MSYSGVARQVGLAAGPALVFFGVAEAAVSLFEPAEVYRRLLSILIVVTASGWMLNAILRIDALSVFFSSKEGRVNRVCLLVWSIILPVVLGASVFWETTLSPSGAFHSSRNHLSRVEVPIHLSAGEGFNFWGFHFVLTDIDHAKHEVQFKVRGVGPGAVITHPDVRFGIQIRRNACVQFKSGNRQVWAIVLKAEEENATLGMIVQEADAFLGFQVSPCDKMLIRQFL